MRTLVAFSTNEVGIAMGVVSVSNQDGTVAVIGWTMLMVWQVAVVGDTVKRLSKDRGAVTSTDTSPPGF